MLLNSKVKSLMSNLAEQCSILRYDDKIALNDLNSEDLIQINHLLSYIIDGFLSLSDEEQEDFITRGILKQNGINIFLIDFALNYKKHKEYKDEQSLQIVLSA